jgi:hypothetical protein
MVIMFHVTMKVMLALRRPHVTKRVGMFAVSLLLVLSIVRMFLDDNRQQRLESTLWTQMNTVNVLNEQSSYRTVSVRPVQVVPAPATITVHPRNITVVTQPKSTPSVPQILQSSSTTTTISTSTNTIDTRPRNVRLVIVGDSISRYQYISLVYFLQTGTWITDETTLSSVSSSPLLSTTPLHCKTPGKKAREQFYAATHSLLQPNEILCDCYAYNENRYFVDTERNNHVTYITKFGKNATSGKYRPNQVYKDSTSAGTSSSRRQQQQRSVNRWSYEEWNMTMHHHIARLQPKPQFLLFNAGLHPHDLHQKQVRQSILEVTNRHHIIPIYKTTTYPNNRSVGLYNFSLTNHDATLCGNNTLFPYCIDLSWTSQLFGNEHYYDYYHFKPFWNQYMNVQTLLYIQQIQRQGSNNNINSIKQTINATTTTDPKLPSIFRASDVEQQIRTSNFRQDFNHGFKLLQ